MQPNQAANELTEEDDFIVSDDQLFRVAVLDEFDNTVGSTTPGFSAQREMWMFS